MRSCTAIDDMEGCLEERGEGGCPRSSLKLWRCWAAALGKDGIRRDELLLGGEAASMLEREDATGEGEEVVGGSRFGVVIVKSGLCMAGIGLEWFGDGLRSVSYSLCCWSGARKLHLNWRRRWTVSALQDANQSFKNTTGELDGIVTGDLEE